jgi:hypothetical protein
MKLATIDFEGDALHKSINQQIFPKGCHFDPGTRVWCATISYDYEGQMFTKQFVTKLHGNRRVKNDEGNYLYDAETGFQLMTVAKHDDDTKVPLDLYKGREHIELFECLCEHDLYDNIRMEIASLLAQGYTICSKGYGKYNYDNMLFLTLMNRYKEDRDETIDIYNHDKCYHLITNVANTKLDNVHTVSQLWKPTHKQVAKGQSIPNQEYLEHGMKHNLEDCENLFKLISKYYKVWDKRRSIEDDFK